MLAARATSIGVTMYQGMRFSRPLMQVVPMLVYRLGRGRPRNLGDLDGTLRVPSGGTATEALHAAQQRRYPELKWEETDDDVTGRSNSSAWRM